MKADRNFRRRVAKATALMAMLGAGLVFGVMRLVNFAYGQLIMAGAFALAYGSDHGWPVAVGIVLCFAVVLALSLAMERVVFRPLRTQSAAVMLIAAMALVNDMTLVSNNLGHFGRIPGLRIEDWLMA